MKNFIFITCLCVTSLAYAGNSNCSPDAQVRPSKLNATAYEPEIRTIEFGGGFLLDNLMKDADSRIKSSGSQFQFNKLLHGQALKKELEVIHKEQLDSIVTTEPSTGEKLARQYFMFDENRWPLKRINSYWSTAFNTWDDVEFYEFDCDPDGYVISQRVYTAESGQRYDYEYNDRKWGTSMTLYLYSNGEWIPAQKGDYVYDDRGNIIQETISGYLSASSSWSPVIRNKAEWDEYGRQANYEPYQWDGSNWIGSVDAEKKEYEWDVNGNSTLVSSFIWEDGQWLNYCRREQDFKDNNPAQCTRQEKKFYNKTLNNWAGADEINGHVYHNTKAVMEYDELGRMTYECAYTGHTADGYTKGSDIVYEWTASEDGGTQCVGTSTLYQSDEESYVNDILVKRYDVHGNQTFTFEKHIDLMSGELVNYLEYNWSYDDQQRVTEYRAYLFDKADNNKKLAASRNCTVYDEFGNAIEYTTYRGQNTGEEDWINYTRFLYAYDQNSNRVKEKAYKWDGDAFVPNWGNECDYDYSILLSEINMWPGADTDHKILETRSYTGVGDGWGYTASTYYYSQIEGNTIAGLTADGSIQVFPGCVDELLNVVAQGDVRVSLYTIQGGLVLTSTGKQIDVSALPSGIYIVEVNGYKTKIVKK